jgi:hypothetical protein
MISLLMERGALIAKGNFEKLPPINEKISTLCKENKDKYLRPSTAFITFERQEGKDRALRYFCDPKLTPKEEQSESESLMAQVDKSLLGNEIIVH